MYVNAAKSGLQPQYLASVFIVKMNYMVVVSQGQSLYL